MVLAKAAYIEQLVVRELRNTMMGTNHDIYDNRLTAADPPVPFQKPPHRIYFYYLTLDPNAAPSVEHYLFEHRSDTGAWLPVTEADLQVLVRRLVRNARTTKDDPPVDGNNFVNVIWRHRSWIIIVIDEQGWPFQKRADGKSAAVFNISKGSIPNHSFFDAVDLRLNIDGDERHAVAFINHMKKDADGADLQDGDPDQTFIFDAYVDVQYRGSTDFISVILDPGGTNQGPIIEP